jgi:hypothetical protein
MSESVLQLRPESCSWIAFLALWFPIPSHTNGNPTKNSIIKPLSRDKTTGRWLYSQGEAQISIAWLSSNSPPLLLIHLLDTDPRHQSNLIIRTPISSTHLSAFLFTTNTSTSSTTTTTTSQSKVITFKATGIDHKTSAPSSTVFSLKFKDSADGSRSAISCAAVINSILLQTIQYHPVHQLQQHKLNIISPMNTTATTNSNTMMMMDDQALSQQILHCLEDPDFMDFVNRLEQLYIQLEDTRL